MIKWPLNRLGPIGPRAIWVRVKGTVRQITVDRPESDRGGIGLDYTFIHDALNVYNFLFQKINSR